MSARCVHCAADVSALMIKYGEQHVVLAQCPSCSKLADPYVERDATTLFIDLLLLKTSVYRHFLWNRAVKGRTVVRMLILLVVLETYISWSERVLELQPEAELPRFERHLLLQVIYTMALHGCVNLILDLLATPRRSLSLTQPSLALMMASLTKLATLFLALVFRREFLDSSSDLRPLYRFLSSHTPELLYRLPDFLHKERSWVLDANGLKNVLVRGGLGATSAIVAFSALLDASTARSAFVLAIAWLPAQSLYWYASSRI